MKTENTERKITSMILFSVIIPVYNTEKYLERCIDSVISQTYGNYEIILVDDGSTDTSPIICDDYREKGSRIRVIHKSNGGLSNARKPGSKQRKATGYSFSIRMTISRGILSSVFCHIPIQKQISSWATPLSRTATSI